MSPLTRWLDFVPVQATLRTKIWEVRSLKDRTLLGEVRWFGRWRQYGFYPAAGCVFNTECLGDLAAFVQQATTDWRRER